MLAIGSPEAGPFGQLAEPDGLSGARRPSRGTAGAARAHQRPRLRTGPGPGSRPSADPLHPGPPRPSAPVLSLPATPSSRRTLAQQLPPLCPRLTRRPQAPPLTSMRPAPTSAHAARRAHYVTRSAAGSEARRRLSAGSHCGAAFRRAAIFAEGPPRCWAAEREPGRGSLANGEGK